VVLLVGHGTMGSWFFGKAVLGNKKEERNWCEVWPVVTAMGDLAFAPSGPL
jgi:hypothetical protein